MVKNLTWRRGVFVLAQMLGILVFSSNFARAAEQVVRFQQAEYRVSQGVGIALVMVERVGGSEGKLTVQYHTEDRAAESWTDYVSANGVLTWESGDAFPKPILIYLIRHDYHLTGRDFNVVLTSSEGAVLGEPQSTVVSIEDGFNLGCAGKLDFSFKPPQEISVPIFVNARVYLHVYPTGKLLVAGRLSNGDEAAVMRLNSDGSVDATFTTLRTRIEGGSNSAITGIAVQSDGKILVSGWFNELETGLVRLLPDGDLDSGFLAASEGAKVPRLDSLALDEEQRILVGGMFNSVYGVAATNLARLLPDGKLDGSFRAELRSPAAGTIQQITHVKALAGGKLLVVQQEFNDSYLVRLNSDGSRDTTFSGGAFERLSALEVQADGRIYVGYHEYVVEPRLVRLNANGSLDESWTPPSFQPAGDQGVMDILVDGSGGVYVSGDFQEITDESEMGPRGYAIRAIAHFLSTGLVDPTFVAGVEMNVGADDVESITSMAFEPSGKMIVAGDFDQIDGAVRKGVGRLYTTGDQCTGFISFDDQIVRVWENAELSLLVHREGETNSAVTVQYEIQQSQHTYGTAYEGEDFLPGSGFVTFQPGERVTHLVIPLINDTRVEGAESVTVILREPNNGGVLSDDNFYVQVIILDDDSQGLPGMPDPNFPPLGFMPGDRINAISLSSDNRVLVGGLFEYALAYKHANIARLNPDLSIDTTFLSNGVPFEVYDIQVQSSGKILVGGEDGLIRLNSDGSRDETFTTFLSGQYRRVNKILIQPDGRILIGGKFGNGDFSGIARLLESGELDGSFNARGGIHDINEWPRAVYDLDLYPDGRIMVFGDFAKISDSNSYYVARLFADGSADNTFQVAPWNTVFAGMLDLDNNRVLIGGDFRQIGPNIQRMGLAGLNQQGALDETFVGHVQVDNSRTVQKILPDRNGKILVAGNFAWVNGKAPVTEFLYGNGLARFNADGTGDETFFTGSGAEFEEVHAVAVLPDGSYLAGGTFVNFAGEPRAAMVHLFGDGGDRAGKVQFRSGQFAGIEGGEVILDIDRIWGTKGPLTVSYRTEDISARAGEDYVARNGQLTFLDGETNKTIRIPLLHDNKVELWDAFRVLLESTEPVLAYRPTADVSITEDDAGIAFDPTPLQVEEGGVAKVFVYYLSRGSSQPVTLDYETISGTALAGNDFTAKTGTITIQANTSEQIEIAVMSDSVNETDENFYVVLKNPSLPINTDNRAEIIIKGSGPGITGFVPGTLKSSPGGNFEATLNVQPGRGYKISKSLDLKEWTLLDTITSSTTEYFFRSSAPEQGAFYKVEELGP